MTATSRSARHRLAPLLALALFPLGCSSSTDNGPGGGNSPLGPGSVSGLVMDVGTGIGLSGAAVSGGGKSTTTDSRGYFSIADLPNGEVTITVTLDGFAPAYATPRSSAKPESTRVTLKKQGTPQAYSPSTEKTLSQSTEAGPYAVIFAANSLDTTDTNLKVSITPVDPTKEASVLPGSLTTADSSILFPVTCS